MKKVNKIISCLTFISGIFVIACYLIYFTACLIQSDLIYIILPVTVITAAAAAIILRKKLWIWLRVLLCAGMCFYMLTFSALLVYIFTQTGTQDINYDKTTVVLVFGCRTYGMTPGRTLRSRLDRAYEILAENSTALCVVSGGQGPNETVTEAVSMRGYLIDRGIDEKRIYAEDNSHNTTENIKYIKQLLDEKGLSDAAIVCVSSIYHLPRIRMMAAYNDIPVFTVPADTPNIYLAFSDTVREYMAWVKAIILNTV